MAILQGDVKLVPSLVMDDVTEGGGAPASTVITDGTSNSIFPDISELNRAIGVVNLRKVFVSVQTDDVDTYLGANVIVAEPPADPNVSVALFSTNDVFDTRISAKTRIEAYLSIGPSYAGFLYGNHITGQRSVLIFQRAQDLPAIGDTLVLRKRTGFSDYAEQYVRVTSTQLQQRTFTDSQGDYTRYILTLGISDALRYDFPGFDVARVDPTILQLNAATMVTTTIVADAAQYSGVVPVTTAVTLGDFSVQGSTLYAQIVPSAQVETPIADARANQVSTALTSTGTAVNLNITYALAAGTSLFIGGGVYPGTLNVTFSTFAITDLGGILYSGGSQVGTIDYANGILSMTASPFGTSAVTMAVNYTPAAIPSSINQSQGFNVTQANRSLNYVFTIEPPPTKGTLNVSYRAAGRWYVLRDDGSGAMRGTDTSAGAGTVNFTTGTVSVTLGALPDVDGGIIAQWVDSSASEDSSGITLENGGKFYWVVNSDGLQSATKGSKTFSRSSVSITWNDGGTARTVTDDGAGNLTGYGTGFVDYANGIIRLSPTTLPATGTTINVASNKRSQTTITGATLAGSGGSGAQAGNIGATNVTPGSVSFTLTGQKQLAYMGGVSIVQWGDPTNFFISDNGSGGLQINFGVGVSVACGTIDYTTGNFSLQSTVNLTIPAANIATMGDNVIQFTNRAPVIYSSYSLV